MTSATKNLGGGVGRIVCGACNGTGLFEEPTGLYPCVECKTSGKRFIMFYKKRGLNNEQ